MGPIIIIAIISGICLFRWCRSITQSWYAEATAKTEGNVLRYFRGDFLDTSKCVVDWGWKEPVEVGQTMSFKVKFYSNNGNPCKVSGDSKINVEITTPNSSNIVCVTEFATEETQKEDSSSIDAPVENVMKVSFTVRKSGLYEVTVKRDGMHIQHSPFTKAFISGPLSPDHTLLARTTHAALSVVTMTLEKNHRIMIDARDEYDNKCTGRLNKLDFDDKFALQIRQASDSSQYPAFTWEIKSSGKSQLLTLDVVIYESGCFKASLTYDNDEIKNGNFDILVLNSTESDEVQHFVEKRNLNVWFECRLLTESDYDFDDNDAESTGETSPFHPKRSHSTGDMFMFPTPKLTKSRHKSHAFGQAKLRKVFCFITPKQLIIKEYFLKVFPKRIFTFRVSPATKVLCGEVSDLCNLPTLIINDGFQPRVILACARRNVLAATFVGILHGHMGQSETFEAKVLHFNKQLCEHHNLPSRGNRGKVNLYIDRSDLLNSSFKEAKSISSSDWCKQFVIHFKDENGLDWGGLNREWIHLVCKSLFEDKNENDDDQSQGASGLFRKMKDDAQALVLPTPASTSGHKLKTYEFAGKMVGKCLLESAIGGEYARQVSARFARSFLAQMIGLPVTYMYFESDDPDLYMTKVKYITENDVNDMELTFSEEVYTSSGTLDKVVNLVPQGSNIAVTNDNKHKYLNRMAQYRLSESVKPEVDSFIKGLTSIVPDHILSVFDENELELVMCGSSNISVDDMKLHSTISGLMSNTILNWFWAVVSSFTQDELARLLQFTTGCSQLPPDGFKALEPRFKISSSEYNVGGLPTAHTCFNELCIPCYDSYEELHRMLKIAITEGATGFGLV